ncbi:CHRD domain-containing protein [Allopontixanthobacter sp.]|uniref:CHRD domain-containing protein n=1 Tax=Allopontixanthobacter sp. TaxID=2906452 RepID=UPI002ABBD68D|nr:CHRD domain-containing protein [Allopontixanthobacter sp.]MDZ4307220.1 CHRD domain-containing protein [Allopontixanthobacter sp.]
MKIIKLPMLATLAGCAALAGCATLEETFAEETADTYYATLTGAQEVGGGDPDGAGKAEISISDDFGQVCWDLNEIRGIGPITAAHIHVGAVGTNGPPVFTLRPANEGGYKGCTDGSEWTQDRIEDNPQAFYVNVHTAEYPNGAIRGQLRR